MTGYLDLNSIRKQIPSDAIRVKFLFISTAAQEVSHTIGGRHVYAFITSVYAAFNVGSYGCRLVYRTITAVIQFKFRENSPQLIHDGNAIIESMICSASLAFYTFFSIFSSRFPLSQSMLCKFGKAQKFNRYKERLDETQAQGKLNLASYKFLEDPKIKKQWGLPDYNSNFIEANCSAYLENGTINQQRVKGQITRDLDSLPIYLGGQRLNDPSKTPAGKDKNQKVEEWFNQILEFLKDFPEEEKWKILCSLQQGQAADLGKAFRAIFNNENLQRHTLQDNALADNSTDPEVTLKLDVNNGVATIQSTVFYKITDADHNSIRRIKATTTILDHRTGKAQFEFTLIPMAGSLYNTVVGSLSLIH